MREKYFITFGSEGQPFKGGWIEVYAESESQARKLYNAVFPPNELGFARFSGCYSKGQFEKTKMYEKGSNLGAGCHGTIKGFEPITSCDNTHESYIAECGKKVSWK